jgi:bacillithiol system protein YtxJ
MEIELVQDADLEQLLERSRSQTVFIFKHSTRCAISDSAYQEFLDFARDAAGIAYGIVHVIENRSLSNAIAQRLGVRHQSPQAIAIRNGQATWHASHFSITADALTRARV